MTTAIVQKVWHEISSISDQIDEPRMKLIQLQMNLIEGFENSEVHYMSDLVTDGIDSIVSTPSTELAVDLSSFIKGLLFIAKSKYLSAVRKHKKRASDLLVETASIFINNIEAIVESALFMEMDFVMGIKRTFSKLRDFFFKNTAWVKKLLSFFLSKVDVAVVKEEYLSFVEKILQKASRYSFLLESSIVYRELAHDLGQDLIERYEIQVGKEYPPANSFKKASIGLLVIMDLWFILFSLFSLLGGEIFGIIFYFSGAILLSFWTFRIVSSLRKRQKVRLGLINEYQTWLNSIKKDCSFSLNANG